MAIVWPQVNGVDFLRLIGALYPMGEQLEDITRPNVGGVGLRERGKRTKLINMPFVKDATSAANADTLKTTIMGWKGSLVTVREESGLSYNNVAIWDAEITRVKKIGTSTDGTQANPTHKMYGQFVFLVTETS